MFLFELGYTESELALKLAHTSDDSNEVVAAKILLRVCAKLDGVVDDMGQYQYDLYIISHPGEQAAIEVLKARDLL